MLSPARSQYIVVPDHEDIERRSAGCEALIEAKPFHMQPGLVSVIMIFLDGEDFMEEAVDSVLAQSYSDFEILLCDDGSHDGSPGIAARYAETHPGRVRVLEHQGHINRGMSATRNLGIAAAKGEYVCFIDADDVWVPEKLAEQVAIMGRHLDVAMLSGKTLNWRSWTGKRDYLVQAGHKIGRPIPPPEALEAVYPLGRAPSPRPSEIMVRTSELRRLGGFEESFRGFYEDQAFFSKVYLSCPVYFSDRIWLKYRQHQNSCSSLTYKAGAYDRIRTMFIDWFEAYARETGQDGPRVRAAIHRVKFRYRHPFLFKAWRLVSIVGVKALRAPRRLLRMVWRDKALDAVR